MTLIEFIARYIYKIRPALLYLPNWCAINTSTIGRNWFIKAISNCNPKKFYFQNDEFNVKLWDITFNVPLFNAGGMFKNGRGYYFVAKQGAGAFLAGTTTALPRKGNKKLCLRSPLTFFPYTNSAINWMGLPNESHYVVAKTLSEIDKFPKCPVGASLSFYPELPKQQDLIGILKGLRLYEKANVDFIEINESCPNVDSHNSIFSDSALKNMFDRLEFISKEFLKKRKRNLPVIVKFSVDTKLELVPTIIDVLLDLNFDGVNFGNTSTDYDFVISRMKNNYELELFNYFIKNFGGGVSGEPIKEKSLNIIKVANEYLSKKELRREFYIIRTGGISNKEDIEITLNYGSKLMQWYTGYFKNFAIYGMEVYKKMFESFSNEQP